MPITAARPRTPVAHAQRRRVSSSSAQPERVQVREAAEMSSADVLASYTRSDGRERQVVARPGAGGSVLVVDRDALTLGDRRLVAHLAPDEPRQNAELVCALYLADVSGRWCRRVSGDDLRTIPACGAAGVIAACVAGDRADEERKTECGLVDRDGAAYRLEIVQTGRSSSELRWCRRLRRQDPPTPVSLREVVGRLEAYEPARTLTARALLTHHRDRAVSVCTIAVELERIGTSATVLNRALREAVLAATSRDARLSMSEIASRCGRVKRNRRGVSSGETTWLARRIGLTSDGTAGDPTPWVHCDVLASIARDGLGVAPREVEVA